MGLDKMERTGMWFRDENGNYCSVNNDIPDFMKNYVDPLMVETLTTNASGLWWPYGPEEKKEKVKQTFRQKLASKISNKIDQIRYDIAMKICPWIVEEEDY